MTLQLDVGLLQTQFFAGGDLDHVLHQIHTYVVLHLNNTIVCLFVVVVCVCYR
jgi:hypothetical protein